jgi:TRAP-type mannitol/chloroaromatic compound transport system permease large subunit
MFSVQLWMLNLNWPTYQFLYCQLPFVLLEYILRQLQLVGFGWLQSHRLCVTNYLIMCVPYFTVMLLILKTVVRTGKSQQLIDGLLSNFRQWSKNEEVCGGEE